MDSRLNTERLIKAVEANDLEYVEKALESGTDPLMLVKHPVIIDGNINNEHYQIPLLFLAKSDEMSVLFLSHAHKINNDIYNMDDLYKMATSKIDKHSIGLFVLDLAENGPLTLITPLLKFTPHIIDTAAINHALINLLDYCDRHNYTDMNSPAMISLIQASSDLTYPIMHYKQMKSPFFAILQDYGEGIQKNLNNDIEEELLESMLTNNYQLWNDMKHKNIDASFLGNDVKSEWDKTPKLTYVSIGLNSTYELLDTLAITKYIEALNTFQLIMLASKKGSLAAFPIDIINYIVKTILPLVLPLPPVESIEKISPVPLEKQKTLSIENTNLKEQVELFNMVYDILRNNEQVYKFATSTHTFPEDNKSKDPEKYMKLAEKHASKNKQGFTAKALEITKLDHDARVKKLAEDQLSKKWLFSSSYDDIKKMKAEAEKQISAELSKGKSKPTKPTSNK